VQLRRNGHRARRHRRLSGLRHGTAGQPEVEDLRITFLGEHDILGFDVAVDDALPFRLLERRQTPLRDGKEHVEINRTLQPLAQRGAGHELLDDEELIVGVHDVVHRRNRGVTERREGPRLVQEPFAALGITDVRHGETLEGDGPFEERVPRPVDLAHTAGAEPLADFVSIHRLPGQVQRGVGEPGLRPSLLRILGHFSSLPGGWKGGRRGCSQTRGGGVEPGGPILPSGLGLGRFPPVGSVHGGAGESIEENPYD
jgi:hypothetical protein